MTELLVNDPASAGLFRQHDLSRPDFVHTNLQPQECACLPLVGVEARVVATEPKPYAPSSTPDGGVCFACGGMTVRTGSCTTCTSCGTTSGCG